MKLRKIEVTEGGWVEENRGLVEVNIKDFYYYEGQYFKISDIKKCVDSGFYIEESEKKGLNFYLNNRDEMANLLEVCEELDFYLDPKIDYEEDLNERLTACTKVNQEIMKGVL